MQHIYSAKDSYVKFIKNSHKSLRKTDSKQKNGQNTWRDLHRKKGCPDGQYIYEKMLSLISYGQSISQNHNAVPFHNLPEVHKWKEQTVLWVGVIVWVTGTLIHC